MMELNSFSKKFLSESPFRNEMKPEAKAEEKKEQPKETSMSESEQKLMKKTMSMTDKAIRNQEYPGQYGVIIGKDAPEMSALNKKNTPYVDPSITKPTYTGGYVGGGDIAGGYYVSTSEMYDKIGKTMNKIGQTVGDAIEAKKKKQAEKDTIGEGVGGDVGGSEEKKESMFNPDGTLKKSASERADEIIPG